MDRRILEIKRLIEELGYEFISYEHKRGGHAKVTVSDGNVRRFVICPVSAGDRRWKLNKPAELKRIFREYYQTTQSQTIQSDTRDGSFNHPDVAGKGGDRPRNRTSPRSDGQDRVQRA